MKKLRFSSHFKKHFHKKNSSSKQTKVNYQHVWKQTGVRGKVSRFCYDTAFYSKQIIKACVILFFGYAPENIIHSWSVNIALSNINSRQLFIQQSSMHYWHIFAAIVFVIACYLVTRLDWHKPVVCLTWQEKRLLKMHRKAQKKQQRKAKIMSALHSAEHRKDDQQ